MASHENRLAKEASPYLLQHAKNPVDWYPWGPEALGRAVREDRPILLSIGYSACHWCHVMERESFENVETAKLMNELFVNVKVDREERPDLDQIYQLVVQLMGQNGGWPLTVFLTPEKKPFFGGTYFPPADRYGMPGFPKVLQAIAQAYRDRRGEVDLQATELTRAIASATALERSGEKAAADARAIHAVPAGARLAQAVTKLSARFDEHHGGFGTRPKFPNTMSVDLLLRHAALDDDVAARAHVAITLDAMRAGGIYDHLGGGFHRYSTDERWLVPHFEKMLYDNALLLRLYTDAHRALAEARYGDTARAIGQYVAREMTDGAGGFYATQDADSEGEEGKFFVWSKDEIKSALAADEPEEDGYDARTSSEATRLALAYFDVTDRGNFEESGKTVLHTPRPLETVAHDLGIAPDRAEKLLERVRTKLFEAREGRIKPFRDEKILAGWNGLLIGALADAAIALDDETMLGLAERAFAFVRARLVQEDGSVLRHIKGEIVKGPGFLDDHAYIANAAVDLYEATGEPGYMATARKIAASLLARFHDGGGQAQGEGGFFFSPSDGEELIHRAKDPYDQAIPSGQAMTCLLLLRLGSLVDPSYLEPAVAELERLAGPAAENPFGLGQTLIAADRLTRGTVDIVLVGKRGDPRTRALARETFRTYIPNRNVAWLDESDPSSREACAVLAEGKEAKGEGPVAYVCRGQTCSLPVSTAAELGALLRGA
ncbi:thioredoxin domain-containing protein [Pendulispora albinea]|uniref:Thioredoxin domain-containing protein n=1 Tax=Pendulispora albinea TaxID=2741071 RepID=A0ABZ2M448_9BACT